MRGRFDYCLPSPTVFDGPPSPGGRGFIQGCGFCDFAFGFAQNDRGWEASCEDGRFEIRGTNQKGVWG